MSAEEENHHEEGEEREEDPVKQVEVPNFTLPRVCVKLLQADDDSPWKTDYEYLEGVLAVEQSRLLPRNLSQQLRGTFFSMSNDKSFASSTCKTSQKALRLGDLLKEVRDKLEKKFHAKLQAMEHEPLVEKFMDALEASDIQKRVFRHVLARATGMISTGGADAGCDSSYYPYMDEMGYGDPYQRNGSPSVCISQLVDLFPDELTLPQVMGWTDASKSIWVKEQIYADNSALGTPAPYAQISAMDRNTINILMGLKIKPSQFQALTSSLLQNTLLSHTRFLETETGQLILQKKETKKEALETAMSVERTEPSELAQALELDADASNGRNKKERLFDVLSSVMNKKQRIDENNANKDEKKTPDENNSNKGDQEAASATPAESVNDDDLENDAKDEFGAYSNDLSYLEDQVLVMEKEAELIRLKSQLKNFPLEDEDAQGLQGQIQVLMNPDHAYYDRRGVRVDSNMKFKQLKQVEKLEQQLKQLVDKVTTKIATARRETGTEYRLEQLCEALGLCKFEKQCILEMVKSVIMPGSKRSNSISFGDNAAVTRCATVGQLIEKFCSTLESKMNSRSFFYKSSTLIKEGILTVSGQDFLTDLSTCRVELDRRLFDYVVGLDTEMSELVNGSHLYLPDVSLEDAILPESTKKRICDAVLGYDDVKKEFDRLEADKKFTYGLGQVLLFYGQSGTGKTMLANALATKLQKKILLVNFPDLGRSQSGAIIKFLFREARINRALLFFDECESLFLDRRKGGSPHMILTELERFEGLCILATNRAFDLDEAMHRRISLAVEFKKPDHFMREKIWRSLQPPKLELEDGINFTAIAKKYELVGGTIKNAWLQSIHHMVQRKGKAVSQEDLEKAASEQVRGQLSMESFDRRIIPSCGIDKMVLAPDIKASLNSIVQHSKAQSVLFGAWGFEKLHRSTTGLSVMFTGAPGTGKSMAAEAIGFDLGKPLLVVNVAELVSKWVGETGKNIDTVFADAKARDAVLVFDEAEGLFGSRNEGSSASTSRHDTMNVGLLLQYIENFSGVCVVITNIKDAIDEAFFRRFRFVLDFEMPNTTEREQIWKTIIPSECPLAKDVDLGELSRRFEMCGGDIKNALLRAATDAALRSAEKNAVTMKDLESACKAELEKRGSKMKSMGMYS